VRYDGDGGRRDEYHDDRETKNRADLTPKVTEGIGNCSRVEEWWDENEEQHVWRQRDLGQARNEREKKPAYHEHRRVGNPQSVGDEAQPRGDSKEKQNELETSHGTIISEMREVSTLPREL